MTPEGWQAARRSQSIKIWEERGKIQGAVLHVRLLQWGVVSAGWPDTGVGFRGCLGNEAETSTALWTDRESDFGDLITGLTKKGLSRG